MFVTDPLVKSQTQWLCSLLRVDKAEIRVSVRVEFSCRGYGEKICFQVNSCCWQNSAPCGCRTDIPVSLLAVTQRPLWAITGCCIPCHRAPYTFKARNWEPLTCQIPLIVCIYDFFLDKPKKTVFKGLMRLGSA